MPPRCWYGGFEHEHNWKAHTFPLQYESICSEGASSHAVHGPPSFRGVRQPISLSSVDKYQTRVLFVLLEVVSSVFSSLILPLQVGSLFSFAIMPILNVHSDDDNAQVTLSRPVALGDRRRTIIRHRASLACHSVCPPYIFHGKIILDNDSLPTYSVAHSMPDVMATGLRVTAVRKKSELVSIQSLKEGVPLRNLYHLRPPVQPTSKDADPC